MNTSDFVAIHTYKWLDENAVSIHRFQSTDGDSWRIDFDNNGARDVAFGVTLAGAARDAMGKAGFVLPSMPSPSRVVAMTSNTTAPATINDFDL